MGRKPFVWCCLFALAGCAVSSERGAEPGPTAVAVDMWSDADDGFLPRLDPPLSPEERTQLSDFEWRETSEIAETDTDGLPAIYYAAIRIDNREQIDALERGSFHYSPLPLFPSERTRWAGRVGVFEYGDDRAGSWVFAFLPGSVYNLVRRQALDHGEPALAVVQLRAAPEAAATNRDGSVSWAYLVSGGFCYRGLCSAPDDAANEGDLGVAESRLTERGYDAIAALARAGSAFLDRLRSAWAAIETFFRCGFDGCSQPVTVTVTQLTADPDWAPARPMVSAWGPGRGLPIPLVGLPIRVSYGFSAQFGQLNAADSRTFNVPEGSVLDSICVRTESAGAFVTADLLATEACAFPAIVVPTTPLTILPTIRDANLQAHSVVADGGRFMNFAFGQVPPRQFTVVVGNTAMLMSPVAGNAFAPSMGGRDPFARVLSDRFDMAIAGTLAGLPIPPELLAVAITYRTLFNVDIVLPPGSGNSRIIAAHEMGHVIFQELLKAGTLNPELYARHWLTAVFEALIGGGAGNQDLDAAVINEAMAELFASQLAGGGNRLTQPTGIPGVYGGELGLGRETYCSDVTPGCFDTDVSAAGTFNERISSFSTLFVDLFDGGPVAPGFAHNGPVWLSAPCPAGICPSATVPLPGTSLADDPIAVPLNILAVGIAAWMAIPAEGEVFESDVFMRGQTRALRLAGLPDTTSCIVYSAHTAGAFCRPIWLP